MDRLEIGDDHPHSLVDGNRFGDVAAVGLHDRHSFLLLGKPPVGVSDALAGTIKVLGCEHGPTSGSWSNPVWQARQRQSEQSGQGGLGLDAAGAPEETRTPNLLIRSQM